MSNFRAPAVPLIAVDPFFSVWSFSDRLTDDTTYHWTNQRHHLCGTAKIDGHMYAFMGKLQSSGERYETPFAPMTQQSVEILPLTTNYVFTAGGVELKLSFMTPLLPDDLMLLSRPISYITYTLKATDGKEHDVKLYFDVAAELAVNSTDQAVTVAKCEGGLTATMGNAQMLARSGDDHRIEWGVLHLIAPDWDKELYTRDNRSAMLHHEDGIKTKFTVGNPLDYPKSRHSTCEPLGDGTTVVIRDAMPLLCADKQIKLTDTDTGFLCIGYDDVKSIQYFGENINAYWRRNGDDFDAVAQKAVADYAQIVEKANAFDKDLYERAAALSKEYAQIVCLAYRQTVAGHKLTWHDGEIQFFSKENYSNGCIATVDVTYPSIPLFLVYNPDLVEGMLNPIFKLVEKGLWEYDFAPHDVGRYPLANKQRYGYTDPAIDPLTKQMPVEECGNMLLCVAAMCRARGDNGYFDKHFDVLKTWADYLVSCGYDPENQLCTDDFAGHLAHNCNLSVKGILGLAAFAEQCAQTGRDGEKYRAKALEFAAAWKTAAFAGDHYRLAFDQADSWSVKYNMVWDKLLGLKVFDADIFETEVAYYKTKMNEYGLPLDNRADYTKSDWQMWSTVLTEDKEYFDAICERMLAFLNETPDRVPFTDWYFTSCPIQRGFQARTVQGGLFINLLKF